MNSLIEKFEQQSFTRRGKGKKYTNKPSRRKDRETKNYWKGKTEKERRKQGKTRYDTFRREEHEEQEISNLPKEPPVTEETITQIDPSEEAEDWIYDGRAVYTYDLEYIEELRMLTTVRGWIVKRSHEEETEAPRKRARIEQ